MSITYEVLSRGDPTRPIPTDLGLDPRISLVLVATLEGSTEVLIWSMAQRDVHETQQFNRFSAWAVRLNDPEATEDERRACVEEIRLTIQATEEAMRAAERSPGGHAGDGY